MDDLDQKTKERPSIVRAGFVSAAVGASLFAIGFLIFILSMYSHPKG